MVKVIIPTDFSTNAHAAIEFAIEVFGSENTEFHLVNAFSEPHTSADMLVSIVDLLEKEAKSDLDKEIDQLKKQFSGSSLQIIPHAEYGSLVTVLEKLVKEVQTDFIAMGTTGASGLKKVFLGSNAADVLKRRIAPTLVIPPYAKKKLKHALIAFDKATFSNKGIMASFMKLVHKHQCEIEFAHVSADTPVLAEQVDEIESNLDPLFRDIGYEFIHLKNESITDGILDHAHKNDSDLLVMIYRKHNFFERLFSESQTQKMAMITDVPLLVLPEK